MRSLLFYGEYPRVGVHMLQEAFRATHGLQCGYCTPGMVMAASLLFSEPPAMVTLPAAVLAVSAHWFVDRTAVTAMPQPPANERRAAMRAANPSFIPRNHLVEEAISAAVNDGYFAPFESLLTVLSMPYKDQPAFGRYVDPPRPDQVVHQTFCGT